MKLLSIIILFLFLSSLVHAEQAQKVFNPDQPFERMRNHAQEEYGPASEDFFKERRYYDRRKYAQRPYYRDQERLPLKFDRANRYFNKYELNKRGKSIEIYDVDWSIKSVAKNAFDTLSFISGRNYHLRKEYVFSMRVVSQDDKVHYFQNCEVTDYYECGRFVFLCPLSDTKKELVSFATHFEALQNFTYDKYKRSQCDHD